MSQKKTQKIIIPKGTINPYEDTLIEIPGEYQEQAIVVARPEKMFNFPDSSSAFRGNSTISQQQRASAFQTSNNSPLLFRNSSLYPKSVAANTKCSSFIKNSRAAGKCYSAKANNNFNIDRSSAPTRSPRKSSNSLLRNMSLNDAMLQEDHHTAESSPSSSFNNNRSSTDRSNKSSMSSRSSISPDKIRSSSKQSFSNSSTAKDLSRSSIGVNNSRISNSSAVSGSSISKSSQKLKSTDDAASSPSVIIYHSVKNKAECSKKNKESCKAAANNNSSSSEEDISEYLSKKKKNDSCVRFQNSATQNSKSSMCSGKASFSCMENLNKRMCEKKVSSCGFTQTDAVLKPELKFESILCNRALRKRNSSNNCLKHIMSKEKEITENDVEVDYIKKENLRKFYKCCEEDNLDNIYIEQLKRQFAEAKRKLDDVIELASASLKQINEKRKCAKICPRHIQSKSDTVNCRDSIPERDYSLNNKIKKSCRNNDPNRIDFSDTNNYKHEHDELKCPISEIKKKSSCSNNLLKNDISVQVCPVYARKSNSIKSIKDPCCKISDCESLVQKTSTF